MAPKKAVTASRRPIRAVKATSDSHCDDMSSASANKVVGSAKRSATESSRVGNRFSSPEAVDSPASTEPRNLLRSRTTEETDQQIASSDEVNDCDQSTVVTSEGRESATQRSDLGGRLVGRNATEGSQNRKVITRSRVGPITRSCAARHNLALASESGQCERQGLTSSPAKATQFESERAEMEDESHRMAYCQNVFSPIEAEQVRHVNHKGCARTYAHSCHSRERHSRWRQQVSSAEMNGRQQQSPSDDRHLLRERLPSAVNCQSFAHYQRSPSEDPKHADYECHQSKLDSKCRRRSMSMDALYQVRQTDLSRTTNTKDRSPYLLRIVCWRCNRSGHKARDCAVQKDTASPYSNDKPARANILSAQMWSKIKVYMTIVYQGQNYKALLDTGCDLSILSSRALPNLPYSREAQDMYAANMSPVPILGKAVVSFSVAGQVMQHEFLVSDAVEEIILGSDWLVMNRCQWNFDSGTLSIESLPEPCQIQLINTGPHQHVRRIYAKDPVICSAHSFEHVQPSVSTLGEEPNVSASSVMRPSASQPAVSIREDESSVSTPSAGLSSTRVGDGAPSRVSGWSAASVNHPFITGHRKDASVISEGDNGHSTSAMNVVKANRRTVHKPLRIRHIRFMEPVEEHQQAKRRRMPRTEDAKQRRREINRGPFPCPYCDKPPFQHRSGFRRHVIMVHHMNCSWNGIVRPFETEEHKVRVQAVIYRGGRHPSHRSGGTTTQQTGTSVLDSATSVCSSLSTVESVAVDINSSLAVSEGCDEIETSAACRRLYAVIDESATDSYLADDQLYPTDLCSQLENMLDELSSQLNPIASQGLEVTGTSVRNQPPPLVEPSVEICSSKSIETKDAAVMVVPTEDVAVQSMRSIHSKKSTQTPVGRLYLPPGMNIRQLVDIVFSDVESSAHAIALRLVKYFSQPLPDERMAILETVLTSMVETQRRLVEIVADRQSEIRGVDGRQAGLLMQDLESYVNMLRVRPIASFPASYIPQQDVQDNATVEEIPID